MQSYLDETTQWNFGNRDSIPALKALAEKYWSTPETAVNRIHILNTPALKDRQITTVAVYYYRFRNGGVERVLAAQVQALKQLGYRVVLITEEAPSPMDFPLCEGVDRVILFPSFQTNSETYTNRIESWDQFVQQYHIDLVIYHAWLNEILLWDVLLLKLMGVSVLMQAHGSFAVSIGYSLPQGYTLPAAVPFLDGMVVLSECDRIFWSHYHTNVHYIPNPMDPSFLTVQKTSGKNKNLLWVGRFEPEKAPWEAIEILAHVVKQEPDTVLYMVGARENEQIAARCMSLIDKYHMEDNVVFTGYTTDVSAHFSSAAIHVMTSVTEGYPMVLLEAAAHGVPTVMYELPWLEMAKESFGVCGVPRCDSKAAANEIIRLLANRKEWEDLNSKAVASVADLAAYDYNNAWNNVIRGQQTQLPVNDASRTMLQTLIYHYQLGWVKEHRQPHGTFYVRGVRLLDFVERVFNYLKMNGMKKLFARILKKLFQ